MPVVENPIIKADYPDPDVIRVGDTYYMVSTTMYFMPGCVILKSYDLANWEIVSYVYETLECNDRHNLVGEKNIYGSGMWAATLRYHNEKFYICFIANDTGKTYLFTSQTTEGPWVRSEIEGCYHDCSLLFDDDDRVYIIYGNTTIFITELKSDLTGPKLDGLHRVLLQDEKGVPLGLEGAHIYKIREKYYIFCIHAPEKGKFMRTEACFVSDSLMDEFVGCDVVNDDMGFFGNGVAQGGIVDTPDGDWYMILFQDTGAVGRIPILMEMHWEKDFPIVGINGKIPKKLSVKSTRPDYQYTPLQESDDFLYEADQNGKVQLKKCWQWNHNPHNSLWSVTDKRGVLRIQTDKLSKNPCQARNTLTQRTTYPNCEAIVTVDGTDLKDGDYAGIATLQSNYAMIAITKNDGNYELVMMGKKKPSAEKAHMYYAAKREDEEAAVEYERIPMDGPKATIKVSCDFENLKDEAELFVLEAGEWKKIGETHKLYFGLDHFTGCRFALCTYSTKEIGGIAEFSEFIYKSSNES
ncbi:MAG TPA: glycoside hydrolase 43 family protein [Lachnospiraceae bacterium]|nr:glycoside hydrolase 43 family protein [Lachnospiraceae bacterium]